MAKMRPEFEPDFEKNEFEIKKVELKLGRFLARPLARKWPKFLVSLARICKDSLLGNDSEPGRSGHFLANGLATMWPLLFQCFTIFVSNVSLAGLRLGRILAMNRGRHPVLGARFGEAV